MKKSIWISITAVFVSFMVLTLHSCQKEETTGQDNQGIPKTCLHPKFRDKVVTADCVEGHSCNIPARTTTKRNKITWRVGSGCPADSFTGTVYYSIYKYSTVSGSYLQYTKIASFTCAGTNLFYAGTILANGTTFIIMMDDVTTSYPATINEDTFGFLYDTVGNPLIYSDSWKFTTGSLAGSPC